MYSILESPTNTDTLGATLFEDATATFLVWAPNASAVTLRIAPDDATAYSDVPLAESVNQGYWSAKLSGAAPEHRYILHIQNNGIGSDNPGNNIDRTDPAPYGQQAHSRAYPPFSLRRSLLQSG